MPKQKFMKYFFIYTVVTFANGIIMKVMLAGWEIDTLAKMSKMTLDPDHNQHMIEAGSGLGTQIALVIITLIAYPVSLIKLYKMAKNPNEVWTPKVQKRLFIEYLIFLIVFIIIDLGSISIIVIEKAPMTGWVLFAVISIIFPTTFAAGSLMFLRKSKKFVNA